MKQGMNRLLVALCLSALLPLAGLARDLTFLLASDVHVGMAYKESNPPVTVADYSQHIDETLDAIAGVVGTAWPKNVTAKAKGLNVVGKPSGLIVAGDLTESGKAGQWKEFERLFPWAGLAPKRFPIFAGAGNHDGATKGAAVRNGLRERNQAMLKAGLLTQLSYDGLHSAWVWQGVHFINVNLFGGDAIKEGSGPDSMWNPEKSLTFLKSYLAKNAPAPTPVVIVQHFGFEKSTWWTEDMRKTLYQSIKGYNVIALLQGHTHGITHLPFPADAEYKIYGEGGPRFDCFSAGALKHEIKKGEASKWRHPCECYVFHVSDSQFVAAHYIGTGWNDGKKAAGLTVVKELMPAKTNK